MLGKTFIEIGGFPGTMSIYFHKKYNCNVSLLDFYIDKEMVGKMEQTNDIPKETIECIACDFFDFAPARLYDIVFSYGFIEHFNDTRDIIQRHVDLLAQNGHLLIVLPNFLGLNGWIQRLFDRESYVAHNLQSMELIRLREIMKGFNLNDVKIEYTGKSMVWLEAKPTIPRIIRLSVKMFSYMLKLFPVRCRLLSPYIVISADKQ
ncbi:MAG: class I SAM-dependent methyltransferase [Dysgonamonadaceae bacterium]|jgi:SAM-dependent methyltransferase|nr:class I SAM-dependent methyltransferase [Dysgonamonadaceae bacterium]